jgi:alpha-beta hydrolase superfamily lysophospholipase
VTKDICHMTVTTRSLARIAGWDNPPAIAPRGTVIVIPGRGEHPGLYERFATRLAFDAYRVRVVGDPTTDSAQVERDIQALLADDTLPAPKILAGSDSGASFAVHLVSTGRARVDALILSGLLVTAGVSTADWDAELIQRTACPTHQARLQNDTNIRRGSLASEVPTEWLDPAADGSSALDLPVLGIHGAADEISPLAAVRARYAALPHAELVSIAEGRHDAFNDATHRTAAATVVLFLERLRAGADIAHQELRAS